MATAASSATQSSEQSGGATLTEARFRSLLVEEVRALAADVFARKEAAMAAPSRLSDVRDGPWYAIDYASALRHHQEEKRTQYLIDKGCFYHGLPPKGFVHVRATSDDKSETAHRPYAYLLEDGVLPVVALGAVSTSLCFLDCTQMMEVAYYRTLLKFSGETWFNSYFTGEHRLRLDTNPTRTPLKKLIAYRVGTKPLEAGDLVSFSNVQLYLLRHPLGCASAYTTCCADDGAGEATRFIGMGLPPAGLTRQGVFELCAAEFNRSPVPSDQMLTPSIAATLATGVRKRMPDVPPAFLDLILNRQQSWPDVEKAQPPDEEQVVICPRIAVIQALLKT